MPSCAVVGCPSNCSSDRTKSYHLFPRSQPKAYRQWVINLRRKNWQPSIRSVVCSDHFAPGCFDRTGQTVRLRAGAVPTIFNWPKRQRRVTEPKPRGPPTDSTSTTENGDSAGTSNVASNTFDIQPSSITSDHIYASDHVYESDHIYAAGGLPAMKHRIEGAEFHMEDEGNKPKLSQMVTRGSKRQASKVDDKGRKPEPSQSVTRQLRQQASRVQNKRKKPESSQLVARHLKQQASKVQNKRKKLESAEVATRHPKQQSFNVPVKGGKPKSSPVLTRQPRQPVSKEEGNGEKPKPSRVVTMGQPKRHASNIEDILQDLKLRRFVSDDAAALLRESLCGTSLELCVQTLKNIKGKVTKEQYPLELRAFALTLYFYSTEAYEHVQTTFDLALPEAPSIRAWYTSNDAEPGFTSEAFESLRLAVQENKKKGENVFCALLMDEMILWKHVEWDAKMLRGFVDVGTGLDDDGRPLATQALVFMVVSLNDHWKLPCGYFLIHGMAGAEKANLVNICLTKLHEIGVVVCSLTCDGLYSNFTMFETLGAELRVPTQEMKPWFPHPANRNQRVFILFDIDHMFQVLRNTLSSLEVIKDPDGRSIRWLYIEELDKLQEEQGPWPGNKLQPTHVKWYRHKTKMNRAAQATGSSVADALEFCNIGLKVRTVNSEATVNLIRICDKLFDLMSSRNPLAKNFKAPLKTCTRRLWKPAFEEAAEYILGLRDVLGQPLHLTKRKTAFVELFLSIKSFEGLSDKLLDGQDPLMGYLLTHKCSQDHLKLFFDAIRRNGGRCNSDPTALQFMVAYKRLLLRDVQQTWKNCSTQDRTDTLHASLSAAHCEDRDRDAPLEDHAAARRFGLMVSQREGDRDCYVHVPNSLALSLYVENVAEYVTPYVVCMLQGKIACPDCLAALQEQQRTGDRLLRKNRDRQFVPSSSVVAVCKCTEKCLKMQEAINRASKELVQRTCLQAAVVCAVLHDLAEERTQLFQDIDGHMYDTEPDNNHIIRLIKLTALCYVKIRLRRHAKQFT